jgi:hypothetical protein
VLIGLVALLRWRLSFRGSVYRGMASSAQLSSEKADRAGLCQREVALRRQERSDHAEQGGEALLLIAEDIDASGTKPHLLSDGSLREQFCEAGLPFCPRWRGITALPGFA